MTKANKQHQHFVRTYQQATTSLLHVSSIVSTPSHIIGSTQQQQQGSARPKQSALKTKLKTEVNYKQVQTNKTTTEEKAAKTKQQLQLLEYSTAVVKVLLRTVLDSPYSSPH